MKRAEFIKALSLARSAAFSPIPYLTLEVFSGCALDNKRRAVTLHEVASLIHGHCATFGGTWLHSGESEIEEYSKRFDIVG
jgi:hypothetical protein